VLGLQHCLSDSGHAMFVLRSHKRKPRSRNCGDRSTGQEVWPRRPVQREQRGRPAL